MLKTKKINNYTISSLLSRNKIFFTYQKHKGVLFGVSSQNIYELRNVKRENTA